MARDVVAGNLIVNIIASMDKFKSNMKQVTGTLEQNKKSFEKFGKSLKVAAIAVVAMGAAMTALSFKLVKIASDAEEIQAKFNTVFKELKKEANLWAEDFGKSVGRATQDVKMWMAGLQDTFVPLGLARSEAFKLSKQLVTLAVDVASFNNAVDAEVIRDFTSALVGNHETVRKFGILISEVSMKQEMANLGWNKSFAQLTELEKVQVRFNIIMNATADAQGDALRTGDSYANQVKRLRANLTDLQQSLGIGLLPLFTELVLQMNLFIKANENLLTTEIHKWLFNYTDFVDILYLKLLRFKSIWGLAGAGLLGGDAFKRAMEDVKLYEAEIEKLELRISKRFGDEPPKAEPEGVPEARLGATRRPGALTRSITAGQTAASKQWEEFNNRTVKTYLDTLNELEIATRDFYATMTADAGPWHKLGVFITEFMKDARKTMIYELENVSTWFWKDVFAGGWQKAWKQLRKDASDVGQFVAATLVARLTTKLIEELADAIWDVLTGSKVQQAVVEFIEWFSDITVKFAKWIYDALGLDWLLKKVLWFLLKFSDITWKFAKWIYDAFSLDWLLGRVVWFLLKFSDITWKFAKWISEALGLDWLAKKVLWFILKFSEITWKFAKWIYDAFELDWLVKKVVWFLTKFSEITWKFAKWIYESFNLEWLLKKVVWFLLKFSDITWKFAKWIYDAFNLDWLLKRVVWFLLKFSDITWKFAGWIAEALESAKVLSAFNSLANAFGQVLLAAVTPVVAMLTAVTAGMLWILNEFKKAEEAGKWISWAWGQSWKEYKKMVGLKMGGIVPGSLDKPVPAIVHGGEEVLTRQDPRHQLNQGGGGSIVVNINNPTVIGRRGADELATIVTEAITRRAKMQQRYTT